MQKVEHMTKEELVKYGTLIGEAFVLEGDGIATTAPKEDIVKAFEIMTEYFYKSGVLYTTSDDHEGFLAYWRKNTKVKIKPMLHMIFRMLREMSFKGVMAVAGSSGELYAKLYNKEKDIHLQRLIRLGYHVYWIRIRSSREKNTLNAA